MNDIQSNVSRLNNTINARNEKDYGNFAHIPLTPIQYEALETLHLPINIRFYEVCQSVDVNILKQAIDKVVTHHESLRLSLFQEENILKQYAAEYDENMFFTEIDLSSMTKEAQDVAIISAVSEVEISLNLFIWPLIRFTMFDLGNKSFNLLIAMNHWTHDIFSEFIIHEDIITTYQQIEQGVFVSFSKNASEFHDWSEYLREYTKSQRFRDDLKYWANIPWNKIESIPMDYNIKYIQKGLIKSDFVEFSVETTKILTNRIYSIYNISFEELIIISISYSLLRWSKLNILSVRLTKNVRAFRFKGLNIIRTVGWLLSTFPLVIELRQEEDIKSTLISITDQLRGIPNLGIGYGLARYHNAVADQIIELQNSPQPQISINYLGRMPQIDARNPLFNLLPLPNFPHWRPWTQNPRLLSFVVWISEGKLTLKCQYGSDAYKISTINYLLQSITDTLGEFLIDNFQSLS